MSVSFPDPPVAFSIVTPGDADVSDFAQHVLEAPWVEIDRSWLPPRPETSMVSGPPLIEEVQGAYGVGPTTGRRSC